jgi:hypothetical protein
MRGRGEVVNTTMSGTEVLEIKLDRANKTYQPGDQVKGTVYLAPATLLKVWLATQSSKLVLLQIAPISTRHTPQGLVAPQSSKLVLLQIAPITPEMDFIEYLCSNFGVIIKFKNIMFPGIRGRRRS